MISWLELDDLTSWLVQDHGQGIVLGKQEIKTKGNYLPRYRLCAFNGLDKVECTVTQKHTPRVVAFFQILIGKILSHGKTTSLYSRRHFFMLAARPITTRLQNTKCLTDLWHGGIMYFNRKVLVWNCNEETFIEING